MNAEELAMRVLRAEVDLIQTVQFPSGLVHRWKARNYMHPPVLSIYTRNDGSHLLPGDDPDAMTEVLREIKPPLDRPREFIAVFELLANYQVEVTGFLSRSGLPDTRNLPQPIYAAGRLIFMVDRFYPLSLERVTVQDDYTVSIETIKQPERERPPAEPLPRKLPPLPPGPSRLGLAIRRAREARRR